jgi:HAMP domain-containing protein
MALSTPQSAIQMVTQLALRLTSGDKDPIRGTKTVNGRTVFSVYDAMRNTGAFVSPSAVKNSWARLLDSEFKNEVVCLTDYIKFPGQGQRLTPCMDIRGLQRLIGLLAGKIGEEYRRLAETTLTRLVAGDETMIGEIEENAGSDGPMQTLAREALGAEHLLGQGPGPEDDAMEVDEEQRMVVVRAIAADMKQFAPLVPIVKQLTDEVALLRTDRDNQARLRHQADGRYGNEIREANKNVREQAEYWKRQAEKYEQKSDAKDQMILECHKKNDSKDQMILECHIMLVEVMKKRTHSEVN